MRRPGIAAVLAVTVLNALAHNILYTYVAAIARRGGLGSRVDLVLFVFGVLAIAAIAVTALLIDRRLRALVLTAIGLLTLSALLLGAAGTLPVAVLVCAGLWGLSFGGTATLFLTAGNAAGPAADTIHPLVVTVWNAAIAGGGLLGGVLLSAGGAPSLPWSLLALLVPAMLLALHARRYGFQCPPGHNGPPFKSSGGPASLAGGQRGDGSRPWMSISARAIRLAGEGRGRAADQDQAEEMEAMITASGTTGQASQASAPGWRRIGIQGACAGLAATAAVEVYAAVGKAAGVSMRAGAPGAHAAQQLTVATFAMAVLMCTLAGIVVAVLIARFARRPVRPFVAAAVALTVVSLVSPVAAAHTVEATKVFLAGGHLIAAAIVIPILAHAVALSRPQARVR
jgi:hypothetical protein